MIDIELEGTLLALFIYKNLPPKKVCSRINAHRHLQRGLRQNSYAAIPMNDSHSFLATDW